MSVKAIPMKMKMMKKSGAERAGDEPVDQELIDHEEVLRLIPHRPPMLMIDHIEDFIADKGAIGVKHLKEDDMFFQGHFPSRKVMPGVMIVEAMAQTAAAVVMKTLGQGTEGNLVYFMSIESTKFRKPVVPGQELRLHVVKRKNKRNVWKFSGEAYVEGVLVAQAQFSAMLLDEK